MSRAQLVASVALWRGREAKAYRLWRSRQRRLDQDDPRRIEAFAEYQEAHAMRVVREEQLSRLPVTRVSEAGRDAMMREEGVRQYAYNDGADPQPGHATFGVGHLLHRGPVTAADRRQWGTRERPLSMAVVHEVFKKDLAKFELAVRSATRLSKVPVTQAAFDAMVSLAFNIGVGGFASSTVVKELIRGDKTQAANAFLLWDKPSMLRPRRQRERELFLS